MSLAIVPIQSSFEPIKALVLDAVSSPLTRIVYARALDDFFVWKRDQPFTRSTVQAHRAHLEAEGYASATVNQRLSAIRKLAGEAAANGLLDFETAVSIQKVPGAKQRGVRMGNWLTKHQAQVMLDAPPEDTLKGKRDRAILALLVGCALRRSEAAALTVEHIQQRDSRWVIVDLNGKGGRLRTVPMPAGVKVRVDLWLAAAGITSGPVLRSVDRHGRMGDAITAGSLLAVTVEYGTVRPHDLRRTCAKLCRTAGGELEQIQLLLGHASISTTERYLGSQQDLEHAPNDRLGLHFS